MNGANIIMEGFMSCCLPCLTFGKTQARLQDPTLQNYSSINADVGTPEYDGSSFADAQELYSAQSLASYPSDTSNGSFRQFGAAKCVRDLESKVPAAETAVPHFGAGAVHWFKRRKKQS